MVLWEDNVLFVADFSTTLTPCPAPLEPGRILAYRLKERERHAGLKVELLAVLTPDPAQFPPSRFHPRGLVVGPDGLLYASNFPDPETSNLGGQVLRFDPGTLKYHDVFVSSESGGDFAKLNRPEGLVFSPHGNLYITGYRSGCTDTDKILIFHGPGGRHAGAFLGEIVLAGKSCPPDESNLRAYGVTMLFGPKGLLFVPISGSGPDTGSVRRYDVAKKTFDVFVPSSVKGGPLAAPWYLSFGKTDPATLLYEDGHDRDHRWSGEY